MFTFCVIDNNTNEIADPCKVALEDWAKELCYCDIEGFVVTENGSLLLADECGKWVYCPPGRFTCEFSIRA